MDINDTYELILKSNRIISQSEELSSSLRVSSMINSFYRQIFKCIDESDYEELSLDIKLFNSQLKSVCASLNKENLNPNV